MLGGAGGSIMEPPNPPLDPRLNKPTPTTSDEAVESETPAAPAAAAAAAAAVAMPPVTTTSTSTTTDSCAKNNGDEAIMGVLEVLIHQARDIHNICIYHKQDVYAKLYLTSSDSHLTAVSTRIINGGGRNPVFNDTLRLNVHTLDSSLKCEIWMLSRARNYLEDQLLGFALVPLSDVVLATNGVGGTLNQEFSLSSTDLFHSPAGFVQLSLSYHGSSSLEFMPINDTTLPDACCTDEAHAPVMLDKIEFPDLKVVNENQMMVSEYFGIPCSTLQSESPQSLITSHNGANLTEEDDDAAGVRVVESFSTGSNGAAAIKHENDTTNGTPLSSASALNGELPPAISSAETGASPSLKDKSADVSESEVDSSSLSSGARGGGEGGGEGAGGISPSVSDKGFHTPIIKIDIEPEETVKQQEIVDMYMKSMQQFTESLAKMKLPMDIENNAQTVENQNSENNQSHVSKGTSGGSRVFYGSRAFF